MTLTLANQITIFRTVLIIPFVICLLNTGDPVYGDQIRTAAIGLFIIMSISDAIDGYIARKCRQITALGTFLDPMADKLMITCASVILCTPQTAIEGFPFPLTVVVLIIGKDLLLLLGFIVTFLMTGHVHIRPVWAGKLSTFLQIATVFSILTGPEAVRFIAAWPLVTGILCWSTGFSATLATFVYIYRGVRYIDTLDNSDKNNSEPQGNSK